MTIIRAPREERFTVVNRTVVADERLSFRALGLLVFLLDKPDNWRVEAGELSQGRGEGRDAVRSALTELSEAGYLTRKRVQNEKGQWITETYLYETPGHADDGFPVVGEPAVGFPGVGFPGAITKTGTKTVNEDCKTTPPTPPRGKQVDEEFDAWWNLYPKKKAGKGEARTRWRKMTCAERAEAMTVIGRHAAWWKEHHTEIGFIPAGVVWLNQRRWEDEEPRNGNAPLSMSKQARSQRAAFQAVDRLFAERELGAGT